MVYRPSALVTVRETEPFSVLVAVTCAPATPWPLSPVTRPETADVVAACARAPPAAPNASRSAHSSTAAVCVTRFIEIPL